MKELCKALEQKIEIEAKQIVNKINNDCEYTSELFDNPVLLDDVDKRGPLRGKHGIYAFIIQNTYTFDRQSLRNWNSISGAGFKSDMDSGANYGDCLYLGSCISKSLYTRMGEHFAKDGTFTALKLNHPLRSIFKGNIICYVFPVKSGFTSEDQRILLPVIENRLHELLLPHCGSSRT